MIRNPTKVSILIAHSKPSFHRPNLRHFAKKPWLPIPQLNTTSVNPGSSSPNPDHRRNTDFSATDFTAICEVLRDPNLLPGPDLEAALRETKIHPSPPLLEAIINHFDSSPNPLFSLFKWAQKQPGFEPSSKLFNSMLNLLGKARQFDSAWMMVLDMIEGNSGLKLVSVDSFAILIRRYARAGMVLAAIRTFEFAKTLDIGGSDDVETTLFEVLLDSLCKEGHVRVASDYLDRKIKSEPKWIPSVRVYNILLNGWFRMRKLKKVEQLWMQMRTENIVVPTVVTYGTLVEGYCRMSRVERAIELVGEMKREGVEPNAVVYNPIVDALAEEGKFKEALGMLERFLVLESGPTLSTYNSLVKGFCKAGNLIGASKILKMMTSRDILPTATTYSYFFRYFSKFGMIEDAMNLYTKMIDSGHNPDRLMFHSMLKMLCEKEKLEWALQVSLEMKARGFDMDLAASTMLIHLLCKMRKWSEAFVRFEDMIKRGIVPQYLTYQRMNNELRKHGMFQMAQAVSKLMASVAHSTNLPNTYNGDDDTPQLRRKVILRKAKVMSNALKACKNPTELSKRRSSSENVLASANQLIEEMSQRISTTS